MQRVLLIRSCLSFPLQPRAGIYGLSSQVKRGRVTHRRTRKKKKDIRHDVDFAAPPCRNIAINHDSLQQAKSAALARVSPQSRRQFKFRRFSRTISQSRKATSRFPLDSCKTHFASFHPSNLRFSGKAVVKAASFCRCLSPFARDKVQ